MISIQRKDACSGCTACVNICPNNCITMDEDDEGFYYPHIRTEKCIDCHLCEKVCPVQNPPTPHGTPRALLARTMNDTILAECTSGGIFTTLAMEISNDGGIVYGVGYDDSFVVRHKRVEQTQDIIKIAGSKYVQSRLGQTFSLVKEDLSKGKDVIFCGTPCQITGLYNFLGKDYSNLILVDLVCHGVPSPKLWESYCDYLKKKRGELVYANFRSKKLGYHVSVMEERFNNKKSQFGSARTNLMSKCFFKNIADRPICYKCPFKSVSRVSDLTLFDGWHASDYVENLKDDDKGYTIVLTQTKKGWLYINSLINKKRIIAKMIDLEQAIMLDGGMAIKSVDRPTGREMFYKTLNAEGIEATVNHFFPISRLDYMIEKSKLILDKIGILALLKKIKN